MLQGFLEGDCSLEDTRFRTLQSVENVSLCQRACEITDRCFYFMYDARAQDCELFDRGARVCDLSFGPPRPSIKECFNN